MRNPFRLIPTVLIVLLCCSLASALAQTGQTAGSRADHDSDRLYLSFIEDAAIAQRQWWEGQLEVSDDGLIDVVDAYVLRGVAAFQPIENLEVGGRVGFGSSDTPAPLPDGSGATDLDLWGKWFFGADPNQTQWTVGSVVTIPTGDNTAGLGLDAFSASAFGALRYRLPSWTFTANLGYAFNGSAEFLGLPKMDGEDSLQVGLGGLVRFNKKITGVFEGRYESKVFTGGKADTRVLAGINWHNVGPGMIRVAFALGLDDGAPDAQIVAGYASEF